ncbi:NUDIX domain-containing protein [Psychrobacillus sp. FSL K6-2684]|uniref:NUDIX domain-containing protein n=1 Tax=Psychrobacillus sp. FSL K6-2684 TaxID=2921547 RepID=UPI0030FCAA50
MIKRNSAKAIIIDDKRILVIKLHENNEFYYILPGGGQETGEILHEALKRECREEAGAEIIIGDIIFVREYIGKNHELEGRHGDYHQTEFMFLCKVEPLNFAKSTLPDRGQIGLEWIPISS